VSAGKCTKINIQYQRKDSIINNHQIIEQLTWNTAAEFIRKLGDEIVVDAILEWSENDHGTRVLYRQLLHGLVRKHVLFAACNRLTDNAYGRFRDASPKTRKGKECIVITSDHCNLLRTFGGAQIRSLIQQKKQKATLFYLKRGQIQPERSFFRPRFRKIDSLMTVLDDVID